MNELTWKYSQKLKFEFCEDTLELYKRLSPLNEQIATKIVKIINDRAAGKSNVSNQDFYKVKNFSLPISLIVTGCYDYDFIQKLLTYVENVKDEVGKNVLFIGCDCGVETCFLASIRPDIKVTGIDICSKAILNANKLAKKLELNNVTFIKSDGTDLPGKYDTIFSVRVAHETAIVNCTNYHQFWFSPFEEQKQKMTSFFVNYATIVSKLLSANGILYSIERLHEMNLLGWVEALKKKNISLAKLEDFSIVPTENEFSLVIANRLENNIDLSSVWFKYEEEYMPQRKPEYFENEAEVFLFSRMKSFIDGYYFLNENKEQVFKLALYSNKEDDTSILYYVCSYFEGKHIMNYDVEQKDELVEHLKSEVENVKKDNPSFKCYKIMINDNDEESLIEV